MPDVDMNITKHITVLHEKFALELFKEEEQTILVVMKEGQEITISLTNATFATLIEKWSA